MQIKIPLDKHQDNNSVFSLPRRNNFIFGVIVICLQIVMSIMYGKFIITPTSFVNVGSVITTILVGFLVAVGFGLYFSYHQHLAWSSLGFNFLIIALCIELYPLVNAFWIKAKIFQSNLYPESFSGPKHNLYLGNSIGLQHKGNTITGALRCALSLIIAFSCIIGRAGALECLFLIIFGTIGFQLNREIIMGIGQDFFGTFSIFAFGSFLGLAVGIVLTLRNKKIQDISYEIKFTGQCSSVAISNFGALLIFVLLPILAYEGDNSNFISNFNLYIGPLSIILSMGSAVITSISCFYFVYGLQGGLRVKDIMNGVIAGGVICGTASFYITTPVLALICGAAGAFIQFIFQHIIQPKIYSKVGIITTYSFSLFGIQSFLGAIFAAGYNHRVVHLQSNNFIYENALSSPGSQFSIYFISAGMGLISGLIIGTLVYCVNNYKSHEFLHDKTQWVSNDGIKSQKQKQIDITQMNKDQTQQQSSFYMRDHRFEGSPILTAKQQLRQSQLPQASLPIQQSVHEQQSESIEFDIAQFLQVVTE